MKKILLSLIGILCTMSMWAAAVTPVFKDFTEMGTNVVYVASHANITQTNTTAIMAADAASAKWLTGYNNEAWTGDNISERTLGINPDTDESMSGKLMGGRMKNAQETEAQRSYWFYVTGVTAVWLYHEANSSRSSVVNVFENGVNDAVFTATTTDKTIKATGLNASKKYIVKVNGNGSDVYFYAAKFFGTASTKSPSTFELTSSNTLFLYPGDQSTITTENNAGTVAYKSNNTNVATVSNTGVITAVAGGTTTISVSDPGSSTVSGRNLSVTVNTLYAADLRATTFKFDNAGYFLANDGKWYFKNGLSISTDQGFQYAALECNGKTNNGMKVSANKTYTINVPAGVTIRSARVTMRSNYDNKNAAANWGTIFGQDLSSETLPYSNETADTKEFDITNETPMTFTPGGNQCQMYIELSTEALKQNSDLTLSSNTADVNVSKTTTVTFTSSSTGAVIATSSNTSVATVDVEGNSIKITGVAGGTATITVAQAADATYKSGEDVINVTVTNPYPATIIFSATATTAYDVTNGTTNGSLAGYATVNGGSMTVTNGQTSEGTKSLIKEQSSTMAFSSTNGNTYFNATLDNAIMAGDVISMKIYGSKSSKGEIAGVAVKTAYEAQDPKAVLTSDGAGDWKTYSYTVKDGDDIVGATALAFCRTAGTTTYFTNITISRPATVTSATLNAQGYGTFSCEYDVQITGAKAYKATINGDALECTKIENGLVPAGEGVLLYGEAGATATALFAASAPAVENNVIKATTLADGSLKDITEVTSTYEKVLVLSGDSFVPYNGAAFVANKAYIPYDAPAGAKSFRIVFAKGGQTTGIKTVSAQKVASAKFIENGRIVIVKDGAKYNVAGQVIK